MQMKVNVVMSAERPARTPAQDAENARRTNELHLALHERDIVFVPARGSYKGTEERSVVAANDDSDDYDWLLELAWSFDQESVLVVDANYVARLVYAEGGIERAGMMVKVNERIARSKPGWTRISNGSPITPDFAYWTIDPEGTPLVEAVYASEAQRLGIPELH
jgi:hypothetical protein